jgi:TRAP-type C4-dicarboxylate transport system permease small subunit
MFRRAAEGLEWVGIAGLMLMLLFTMIDVIGSTLFNTPLKGATEWVGYVQIIAIASSVAIGFYIKRHIAIDFLVSHLPSAAKKFVKKSVALVCFVFFIVLCWQSIIYGLKLQQSGEISSTANIPLYPFAYFIAVTAVVASLYFVGRLLPAGTLQTRERSAEHESS